jgi:ketosteroid isomerase-like protein
VVAPRGSTVVGGVLAILLAAGGWLAWKTLFPSDEQRIRARLDDIAEAVNARSDGDGLNRLADAARLASFFTEDVAIDPGPPHAPIRGREAVVATASSAGRAAGGVELSFVDVQVAVGDAGAATAHMTLQLTWTNAQTRERTIDAREIALTLREVEREWRVARVSPVQTLERPD